ncbi:MAG: SbcC/MukB-like Walker B domain-containing protein [Propionicimonas sp.]|nr:SbcC/MukB-like Walker B domain-containing protein [Propionicimonas sp.]
MSRLLFEDELLAPAGSHGRFGTRWRLVSAGLSNVWRYGDLVLPAPSGRLLLRGPNGTGKTTALEALWPFLLDLDRTKLPAGKARTTTLTALMRENHHDRKRIGYAWLTFAGPGDEETCSYGVRLAFSNGSTPNVKVEPFRISGEPLVDLPLVKPNRAPYSSAEEFREAVEAAGGVVFLDEPEYVTALAAHIFGTDRESLVLLAHRVRQVRNPSLLAETSPDRAAEAVREALPGVAADIIEQTAEALAATEETRAAFERDAQAARRLTEFATIWQQYAAGFCGDYVQAAATARDDLMDATRLAERKDADHQDAVKTAQLAAKAEAGADAAVREAAAEIESIERSPAYATVERLADLQQTMQAKVREAQARADNVETATRLQATAATRDVADARSIAESLAATSARASQADPRAVAPGFTVRTRPQAVLAIGNRSFDPGTFPELPDDLEPLTQAGEVWSQLAGEHEQRQAGAELLLVEHRKVVAADAEATRHAESADRAEESADEAVKVRDQRAADARQAAGQLAEAVTSWAADNPDLTVDADSDRLTAEAIGEVALGDPAALLEAATAWSQAAVRRSEAIAAGLESHARERDQQARALADEATALTTRARELRGGKELLPPRPEWTGEADERALSNALQWRSDTPAEVQPRVEAALLTAGLLGASLADSGVETEAWAVSTVSPPASTRSLAALIEAAPEHPLAGLAQAVLERITLADSLDEAPTEAATVIGIDGTFRLGTLTGHAAEASEQPHARYIGAAQRRAAALAEADRLEQQAAALSEQSEQASADAESLREDAHSARARASEFPNLSDLRGCEHRRAAAATAAASLLEMARAARERAETSRATARELSQTWAESARGMGLPADPGALRELRQSSQQAASTLRGCVRELSERHDRALALRRHLREAAAERERLATTHAEALAAHHEAERAQTVYQRLQDEQGRAAAELTARLSAARASLTTAQTALASARTNTLATAEAASAAEADARNAAGRVREREPAATHALARLRELAGVPEIAQAFLGGEPPADSYALVEQLGQHLVGRPSAGRRKLTETYEETRANLSGTWAIDRAELHPELDTYRCSFDGTPLTPAAAAELARSVEERARTQLEAAEESALRDFIIGRLPAAIGVAWTELRDWVDEVNRKMEHASASSGVGVRVKAQRRDDLSPNQRTVYQLACRKSASTRTGEENEQLAAALKELLEHADADTVGDRVRQAVDIRQWVRVEYWIHRPGQEPSRWTSRTGLSGGERRLVILAPMLASIAALHDSFPPTALRLTALDEVPAEVDEQGREGLARYLAELDLDVICTSYLWDGAPGAWDGIDAYDLEAVGNIVVGLPMLLRGLEPLPGDEALLR